MVKPNIMAKMTQQEEMGKIPIPSELEGKGLGTHSLESTHQTKEGVISTPTPEISQQQGQNKYAQHLHTYVREYIAAADRKASFVFTIGAALLVYLYEKNIAVSWLVSPFSWSLSEIIAFVSMAGLSISCVLSVFVVFPRLSGSKRGFIFWESITEFNNPSEFSEAAQKLSDAEITRELLLHSYELSAICKKKYVILNWALRIGGIGAIATIIYLLKN